MQENVECSELIAGSRRGDHQTASDSKLSTLNSQPCSFRHEMLIHLHLANRSAIALVRANQHLRASQWLIVRRRGLALVHIIDAQNPVVIEAISALVDGRPP